MALSLTGSCALDHQVREHLADPGTVTMSCLYFLAWGPNRTSAKIGGKMADTQARPAHRSRQHPTGKTNKSRKGSSYVAVG